MSQPVLYDADVIFPDENNITIVQTGLGDLYIDTDTITGNGTVDSPLSAIQNGVSGSALKQLYFESPSEQLPNGGEVSNILIGDTLHQWYRLVGDLNIYYRTSNNAMLTNWTSPVLCTGLSGEFPTVFEYNGVFFMFIKTPATTGNIYLYRSVNKISWQVLNNGIPVINSSPSSPSSWKWRIYNVGACMEGSTIHILVEGASQTGFYSDKAWFGYAKADISSPVFMLPESPVFPGGNASLYYSKNKKAIIVVYGEIFPDFNTGKWRLRGATGSLESNLTRTESWVISDTYFPDLGEVADPDIVFTPNKTYSALISYNLNQATGYQAYTNYIANEDDLYNALSNISGNNKKVILSELKLLNDGTQQKVGVGVQAKNPSGLGSQPAYNFFDNTGAKRYSIFCSIAEDYLGIVNNAGTIIFEMRSNGRTINPNQASSYVPASVAGTNVSSPSASKCLYTITNNIVTVKGSVTLTATTGANTASNVYISLPVSSDLISTADLSGVGATRASLSASNIGVQGDIADNRANLGFTAVNSGSITIFFDFSYEIL